MQASFSSPYRVESTTLWAAQIVEQSIPLRRTRSGCRLCRTSIVSHLRLLYCLALAF